LEADQSKLEQFLNGMEDEVISIVPNVTWFISATLVNFLRIVEKIA
jgi:hypothetical protein